ncbi:MAG: WecB/TagA/CpsF family glycosyltransferase [Cyanobacteria bacterium SID2]|nr:WecB/TagA/CpsF family glycosyltransferase [Cyanobacteria bacterium SID2]MBP0003945.1 WecB/TagA/CpsF family glycosyltransferase [Cyanobacteria bacterium SBC]
MSEELQTFKVLGMPVHLHPDYTAWLRSRLAQNLGVHVVTLNAEMTMQAEQNAELARAIHQAELVVPDGAGVVLYLQLWGKRIRRCPGIELAQTLLSQLSSDRTVFFYGGKPGVAQTAADTLKRQYPELNIVGVQHGYLSEIDRAEFARELQQKQPDVILVGLGVPRQEIWIVENRNLCPNAIWLGVGGSFDIWAGIKTRAPAWMGNNHLEWAYRLYQEPWRWRRMLALPKFALKALGEVGNRKVF